MACHSGQSLSMEGTIKLRHRGKEGADMERVINVGGSGNCMCKGPEVEEDLVCSRLKKKDRRISV